MQNLPARAPQGFPTLGKNRTVPARPPRVFARKLPADRPHRHRRPYCDQGIRNKNIFYGYQATLVSLEMKLLINLQKGVYPVKLQII